MEIKPCLPENGCGVGVSSQLGASEEQLAILCSVEQQPYTIIHTTN
jgi:hypothetical protein